VLFVAWVSYALLHVMFVYGVSCLCAVSADKVAHLLYSSFLAAGGCVVCASSQPAASVFEDSLFTFISTIFIDGSSEAVSRVLGLV
jgi:hypothetical protein